MSMSTSKAASMTVDPGTDSLSLSTWSLDQPLSPTLASPALQAQDAMASMKLLFPECYELLQTRFESKKSEVEIEGAVTEYLVTRGDGGISTSRVNCRMAFNLLRSNIDEATTSLFSAIGGRTAVCSQIQMAGQATTIQSRIEDESVVQVEDSAEADRAGFATSLAESDHVGKLQNYTTYIASTEWQELSTRVKDSKKAWKKIYEELNAQLRVQIVESIYSR